MNKFAKFGLAAIAVTVAATSAMAIVDTEYRYATPKPGNFTVNPMAMAPDGFSAQAYAISWGLGALEVNADASESQCFNTNVNLPASVKITGLRVWSRSSINSVLVRFEALVLPSGVSTSLVNTTVGDGSGDRVATFISLPSITATNNTAYGLGVCLDPGEQFNGARIEYTAQNAGD